jgi:hypothetical protein
MNAPQNWTTEEVIIWEESVSIALRPYFPGIELQAKTMRGWASDSEDSLALAVFFTGRITFYFDIAFDIAHEYEAIAERIAHGVAPAAAAYPHRVHITRAALAAPANGDGDGDGGAER